MGATLNESDIHVLHERLDVIFTPGSTKEAVREALNLLKAMIEPDESTTKSGNGGGEENKGLRDATAKDRANALKEDILATRPNFFEHLLMLPKDEDTDLYVGTFSPKSEVIVEMLRNFPLAKLAFAPYVDQLLQSSFRENSRQIFILRVQDRMTRAAVAELLRPDPAAVDANKATQDALSKCIQSFSEILSPSLQADNITEVLAKQQQALAYGLLSITEAPLHPDATPVFIQVGGLDALLAIIHRGPLSIPDMESPNESVNDACDALFRLMDDSGCEVLVDALVERQAISPLLKQMAHVCVLEGMYNRASLLVQKLVSVSRPNETLRKQVIAEAKAMVASNPKKAAKDNAIDEMKEVSKSKKYVPFFLAPCELGASDDILDTVGEALAARVGQPGDQLRKGISTPEQVEKFVALIEHACTRSAADISPTIRVLRELILPADQEATGSVNGHFCRTFGKAIKARFNAAQALASRVSVGEGNEVQEPSEEGLANLKNVKMLSVIVDEQYSALTLIVEADLLEYLQYLAFNPRSPLSRRAGLELITALTHDSSLSSDFEHVPDVIDGFMEPAVFMLDDPRALIRSLAMQWLVKTMSYHHPKAQELYRYKPAIDFVTKSVTEEKLVEMIKGTENEVQAAASMTEAMVRHSTGLEVRERLKKNQELVEGLWNGVFWDTEKAPEDKDADISEDALIYGNTQPSCGEALTEILDPFIDHANIIAHIMPHIALAEQKEPYEFCDFLTNMPGIASLAILAPETGVLSVVGKMIANEEQLPYVLTALQHLSEGLMLAKWSLGQSNDIYPALIKVLREGGESSKNKILSSLDSLLYGSTASRMKLINSGGIKPLLDAIALEDERISRKAISSFISLVTDFPEGAKAAIDAGAIAVLEAKEDLGDVLERKSDALELLKSYKDILDVDRIELTPEGYATFGKGLSEPGAIKRLVKNLKSSLDEKELAIAGGLLPIFTDILRSSTDPLPLLEALRTIYVADGALLSGHNIAVRVGLQCGLPDMLRPLIESEDETIRERATEVLDAVEAKHNDEIQQDEDEEDEEDGVEREAEDEPEVPGADNEG